MSATDQALANRPPFAAGLRRWLIGRGFLGKDLVQFAPVWLAIGVCLLLLLILRPVALAFSSARVFAASNETWFILLLNILAYALGLAMFGEEEESETRHFAGRLPIRVRQLVLGKILSGALVLFLWVLVFYPVTTAFSLFFNAVGGELIGPLELVLPFCMALTLLIGGMTAAAWHTRTVVAAVAGGVELGVAWVLMHRLLTALFPSLLGLNLGAFGDYYFNGGVQNTVGPAVLTVPAVAPVLAPILLLLLAIRVSTREDVPAGEAARMPRSVEGIWGTLQKVRGGRALRASPSYRILRAPALALGVIAVLVVPELLVSIAGNEFRVLIYFGTAVSAPLVLGVIACARIERHSESFFVSALPVSRFRHEMHRVLAMGIVAAIVAAALWTEGWGHFTDTFLRGERIIEELPAEEVPFVLGSFLAFHFAFLFVVAFSSILIGYVFRFFSKSFVVSLLLAAIPAAIWGFLLFGVSTNSVRLITFSGRFHSDLWSAFGAMIWPTAVSIGLPMLLIWLTTCRSPLLEQGDGRRAAIGILLVFLLTIWGGFLLTLSPVDLVTIILN